MLGSEGWLYVPNCGGLDFGKEPRTRGRQCFVWHGVVWQRLQPKSRSLLPMPVDVILCDPTAFLHVAGGHSIQPTASCGECNVAFDIKRFAAIPDPRKQTPNPSAGENYLLSEAHVYVNYAIRTTVVV
jgi:hypothetical protein